jgi:hypothetical protein
MDISEKVSLDSIKYLHQKFKGGEESRAAIFFRFNGPSGKYYHNKKGNTLIVEFYDIDINKRPFKETIGSPFKGVKITTRQDNIQLMEEMGPKLRDVMRMEFTIKKGEEFEYTVTGAHNLVTLSTVSSGKKAAGPQDQKMKSNIWKYVITGAVIAGVVGGIAYLASSTEDTSGEIHKKSN